MLLLFRCGKFYVMILIEGDGDMDHVKECWCVLVYLMVCHNNCVRWWIDIDRNVWVTSIIIEN